MNVLRTLRKDLSIDQAGPHLGEIALFHRGIEPVEMLRDDGIQDGIAEEFKPFVGLPPLVDVLQERSMEERFEEEGPPLRVVPDDVLEAGEIERFAFERCYEILDIGADVGPTPTGEKPAECFSECREHTELRPNRHITLLSLIFPKEERSVVATEPKRVADGNVDCPVLRGVGYVVEVAVRIWNLQVDRWMNFVFDH